MKFSGCIWCKIEFGNEKGNLEALSKKVNLMSEILARPVWRNHLRKPHDKQVVSAKQRGIWREKCTMLSKRDLSSDTDRDWESANKRGRTSFFSSRLGPVRNSAITQ